MKAFNTKNLIKEIAKEHGKTPREIRAGIEEVIDVCWNNPDPQVHEFWQSMSPRGTRPTVEESKEEIMFPCGEQCDEPYGCWYKDYCRGLRNNN